MTENYQVNWSKTSIAITFVVFAIVIAIIVGLLIDGTTIISVEYLIIGMVLICLLYVASYTPVRIELSNKTLIIHRKLGSTSIPIDQISGCDRYYPTFLTKVFGSGGFCGSLGWYRTNETGLFVSYVTDWGKAVLINIGTRKYMISCNTPDKLVSDLDRLIFQLTTRTGHSST
ncbi:MAG: PH domain-containing protein [Muribaculaceae bacterium]|nr:PH domain-containing protein [Muribaculaceae bacterium]